MLSLRTMAPREFHYPKHAVIRLSGNDKIIRLRAGEMLMLSPRQSCPDSSLYLRGRQHCALSPGAGTNVKPFCQSVPRAPPRARGVGPPRGPVETSGTLARAPTLYPEGVTPQYVGAGQQRTQHISICVCLVEAVCSTPRDFSV
ncbi:hypothetical protein NDU88_010821 [Pleurodeles waltl]|uniref:Uncharacterized protein n=1 Tax=Pleurodeles waltl TaxID=8319 RepID=A0AAV7S0E1_PLEWA|nr:hypothetical protein NDU88_010821 [Pleurodeles waltl]